MEKNWDIDKIQQILPQRYPFLFIDRVIDIDEQKGKITCIKNITINDYFFEGHFPRTPILPGAIIIEAMAQSAILLFAILKPDIAVQKPEFFLGKVEVRFLRPVKPGDQLVLGIEKEKILSNAGIVKAMAFVKNEVAAQGNLIFRVKL